ncbi:MAG TPA: hypothetical protein VMU42_16815, partial [Candidatus Sulfotelmatobacter sp.]|nr:hypothetical protein [Candidatus Sulfotelmatobacter sp.]
MSPMPSRQMLEVAATDDAVIDIAVDAAGRVRQIRRRGNRPDSRAGDIAPDTRFGDLVHPDDRAAILKTLGWAAEDPDWRSTVLLRLRDGAQGWSKVTVDISGRPERGCDLALKFAEAGPAEHAEKQFREIVEGARHGLLVRAMDGRALYANLGFAKLFG